MYDGPIIDGHAHPMLGIGDQMVAEPHPPERYRELVSGSAISRAAALVMAPKDEIDRVAAAGCAWLKLHPTTQEFDVADPAVTDVVTRATERGLPLLSDAYSPWDADQPGKFVNLALAAPESRLILAHAHGAGYGFTDAEQQAILHDNAAELLEPAKPNADRSSDGGQGDGQGDGDG